MADFGGGNRGVGLGVMFFGVGLEDLRVVEECSLVFLGVVLGWLRGLWGDFWGGWGLLFSGAVFGVVGRFLG